MRKNWKPISWTSWIASSRVVTKRHRSAGHISQKRMARVGRSVFLPSKTRWRRGQSSWYWSRERLRWVLDIDIEKYFDSIPHSLLRDFLDQRVTDGVIRRT